MSSQVGPIIFGNPTARKQFLDNGEVYTFRTSDRTTGDTWARATRTGEKLVDDLRQQGHSWQDVFDKMNAVFTAVDQAAFAEHFELVPEWSVAVRVSDPNTPSGERYEYVDAIGRDREEVFEQVRTQSRNPVIKDESERTGYARVS